MVTRSFELKWFHGLSLFCLCFSAAAQPCGANNDTLCRPTEEVYFSCATRSERIISLCASGNISPNNGHVQYRFGGLGDIELQYPRVADVPFNRFFISDIHASGVSFTHVRFKSNGYDYVIYDGFPSGVYVLKDGRNVANHVCSSGAATYRLSPRAFRGITTVPPDDEIDG